MEISLGKRIESRLRGFAEALANQENLSEKYACRRVVLDLTPTRYDADKIQETRASLGVGQGVFARLLGVSLNTIRAWERGKTRPSRMARRFLDELRRDPRYWRNRIEQSLTASLPT